MIMLTRIGAIYTVKNQIYDYPLESNQIKNLNLGYEFSLSDEKNDYLGKKINGKYLNTII